MSEPAREVRAKRTTCKRGHPFSGVNSSGFQICRTCLNQGRRIRELLGPKGRLTLAERVNSHVTIDTDTGCWVWTASRRSDGYGQIRIGGKNAAAHRISYEIAKGEIPPGAFLCHTCDNRGCVNPDHLFLGDHKLNAQDAQAKGRLRAAETSPQAKLTNQQALEIRESKERGVDLARRYNVSSATISQIRRGHIWTSLAK